MGRLGISAEGDYFERDGIPFFYLADTAWMAFSRLNDEEWREYLHIRKVQGFNVVQVSLFPLNHDNSVTEKALWAFERDAQGRPDYEKPNEVYMDRAERMAAIAAEYGITLSVHLLWAHLIPGSWACVSHPEWALPERLVEPVFSAAICRLRKYEPIWSISGDIRFENEAVTEYCLKVLHLTAKLDPEGLTTMHLAPGEQPDERLILDPALKFYAFQSGHRLMEAENPEKFAAQFLAAPVKRPIVNTEPCYEGHKHGFREGRFDREDVRRAVWTSVLSGAKAGVSYGAHGIWSFHRREDSFNNPSFSGIPYDYRTALRFPGAWDCSFLKTVYEAANLFSLQPAQELLENPIPGCRCAVTDRCVAVYLPWNSEVILKEDLSEHRVKMLVLGERIAAVCDVYVREGKTVLPAHDFNSDVLYLFEKPIRK